MGLFKRKRKPGDRDLAEAVAKRGVPVTAQVESMQPTGQTGLDGQGREIEFHLSFTPHNGKPMRVVVRQCMNDVNITGLEPGAPASILYDREDPRAVVITGSPQYRIVEPGVAVRVEQ